MPEIQEKKWYVIKSISGLEKKVVNLIKNNIKLKKMENFFGKILIPSEIITEIKRGKKKITENNFFPGYIFINMIMNEQNWHFIKNTPKVTGFIGKSSIMPSPVSKKEMKIILEKIKKTQKKSNPKKTFSPGELIKVKEGPFIDFNGSVREIDYSKNRIKVSISIFGRSTLVELDFSKVEKISD